MPRINFFLVSVHQEQHTNCRSSEHKHPEGYESESIIILVCSYTGIQGKLDHDSLWSLTHQSLQSCGQDQCELG